MCRARVTSLEPAAWSCVFKLLFRHGLADSGLLLAAIVCVEEIRHDAECARVRGHVRTQQRSDPRDQRSTSTYQRLSRQNWGRSCSKRPVASPRSNASWKKTSRLLCARVRRTRLTIASGCSGGSLHLIASDLAYPGDCTAALTDMARRSWSCHAASKDRCLPERGLQHFLFGE